MRRSAKVTAVIVATAIVLVFFFAPIVYWFGIGPAYATPHPTSIPVYRSASCSVLGMNWGLGVTYSQYLAANGCANPITNLVALSLLRSHPPTPLACFPTCLPMPNQAQAGHDRAVKLRYRVCGEGCKMPDLVLVWIRTHLGLLLGGRINKYLRTSSV
jgi:hypothetical protein